MDDRLRALDRATRGDPEDHAAAWALVRAFEQAGDEVCDSAWRSSSA